MLCACVRERMLSYTSFCFNAIPITEAYMGIDGGEEEKKIPLCHDSLIARALYTTGMYMRRAIIVLSYRAW